jgi:FGAM-synthase: phosphoribosylformylglycinamidine synthase
MVYRIYVEKKPGFDGEAQSLRNELVSLLGIKELSGLRLLNRYDVEGIDEALFEQCVPTVFSEPPVDNTYASCPSPTACLSPWSTCPASSTSAPTLPPSASSSSVRASARWCALPASTCWRAP